MADRYLAADELLAAAGLRWYEVSNWAAVAGRDVPAQPALLDRRGLVGRRARRAQPRRRDPVVERPAPGRVRARGSRPAKARAQAREILTETERRTERIMLLTRLAAGCPLAELDRAGARCRTAAVADGLAERAAHAAGRVVLTRRAVCWPTR